MLRSVKITDVIHGRLKVVSKETGIKIQFIMEQAIEEWMRIHVNGSKPKKVGKVA
jgi:hypothetical protein